MARQQVRSSDEIADLVASLGGQCFPVVDAPEIIPEHEAFLEELPAGAVQEVPREVRRIIIIDDDNTVVYDLKYAIERKNNITPSDEPIYEIKIVNPADFNPPRKTTGQKFRELAVTSTDVVVVDLNYRIEGLNYSGHDILESLDNEIHRNPSGLEGIANAIVICATSMQGEICDENGRPNPRLGTIRNYPLYGMQKAVTEQRGVIVRDLSRPASDISNTYGERIFDTIAYIQSGNLQPLNK